MAGDERSHRRDEAVRQVVEDGRSPSDVARQWGIPRQSVSRWVASHKRRERAKMPLPSLLDAVAIRCARLLAEAQEYGAAERNAAIVMGIAVDKRRVLADERATSTDHNVALRWLKGEAARVLVDVGGEDVATLVAEREPGGGAVDPEALAGAGGAGGVAADVGVLEGVRGGTHAGGNSTLALDPDARKYTAS